MGADPSRTALFAVWRDAAALAAFEDGWFAARAARMRAGGGEVYGVQPRAAVRPRPVGRTRRARRPAPAATAPRPGVGADGAGVEVRPVAVLTRATVRPSRWHRFRGSRPPVSRELAGARGLHAAVGIGEAPVGLQATFSIWSDAAAVAAFARSPEHRAVVRRTREEGWYGEELFARFTPLGSTGTWDGRDPLSRR